MLQARRSLSSCLASCLAPCLASCLSWALVAACNPGPPAGSAGAPNTADKPPGTPLPGAPSDAHEVASADAVAELTAVHGPAGARTEDLAEGTFLGAGARLRGGQVLLVPRGTLAELKLADGTLVRLNEDSRLLLPDAPRSRTLELRGGELVAILAAGQQPLTLKVGDDTLEVSAGEAHALARGDRHSYDVVYGAATLRSGGQQVALTPGAHLETPLAPAQALQPDQAPPPIQPEISLRPLEDTAWSRTFEIASAMADAVPAGVGSLTARRAGTQTELHRLALTEQKVHVAISGRIARTEVEQTFYNEAAEVLEGTYRFPLPADASISGLSLRVGDVWMDAEMLEKERARQIFRQIVDATIPRDPALLEWEQGNIFKMKIFPIPGRGERKIRLSYTQVLPTVGDALRYRYPIAGASSGATGDEIGAFDFTVAIDRAELSPDALAAIATPMAQLDRRELPGSVELSTHKQRFRPVHDLGVDIPITADDRRQHAETYLDKDGQAYFMLALKPDLKLPLSDRPIHYAFVMDRSHSMTPELWVVARSVVQALASSLGPDDRMTLLACDTACDAAPGGLAPAAQAMPSVDNFLDSQILAGASDIGGMMRSAADALHTADPDGPNAPERVIVYLGDGNPSAGELAPDELLRHLETPLAGTRVQAVALGARSDILLLDALTRRTGGDLLRADAKDDLRGLVRELRLRAAVPVARDVQLTVPRGMEYVHPQQLSALRPGDTVLLVGKLSAAVHGPLELHATSPSGHVVKDSFVVDLEATPAVDGARHTHLPRTWARFEIDDLTATKGYAARPEIISLSQQYTVLSRYTALLVLENDAMFREFNVVRQAGKTTGWSGQLPAGAPPVGVALPGQLAKDEASDAARAPAPASPPPPVASPAGTRSNEAASAPVTTPAPGPRQEAPSPDPRDDRDAELREAEDRGRASKDDDDSLADKLDVNDELASSLDTIPQEKQAPASRATAKPAPAKKAKSAEPSPDSDSPFGDDGYGLGGGASGRASGGRIARPVHWKIGPAGPPTRDVLAKLAAMHQEVLRDPTRRPAHRKLVESAVRAGAPEAFAYATAWSHADPDHAPALLAVADLLAARSDPAAMRAYGSAAEVNPFNLKLQTRLADAYASKGDITRSCAHRRAVVSIEPARPDHHLQLARCLSTLGRQDLVLDALSDGLGRARGNLAELNTAPSALRPARVRPVTGDLKATLTWHGAGDLDLAIIDRRGRRLSALRPEGIVVQQTGNGETAGLARVAGTVTVEVTRFTGQGPVSGELKLRTPETTRVFPFTIDQGSLRLANVTFTDDRRSGW